MQNNVCLTGRIARDIEIITFENGDRAANFSLAVQRNYKNRQGEYDCDFINCQARNGTADLLAKYFKKGDFCPISGELKTRKYEKDGKSNIVTYVDVNNVTFVNSKKDDSGKVSANTDTTISSDDDFLDIAVTETEEDPPF